MSVSHAVDINCFCCHPQLEGSHFYVSAVIKLLFIYSNWFLYCGVAENFEQFMCITFYMKLGKTERFNLQLENNCSGALEQLNGLLDFKRSVISFEGNSSFRLHHFTLRKQPVLKHNWNRWSLGVLFGCCEASER